MPRLWADFRRNLEIHTYSTCISLRTLWPIYQDKWLVKVNWRPLLKMSLNPLRKVMRAARYCFSFYWKEGSILFYKKHFSSSEGSWEIFMTSLSDAGMWSSVPTYKWIWNDLSQHVCRVGIHHTVTECVNFASVCLNYFRPEARSSMVSLNELMVFASFP